MYFILCIFFDFIRTVTAQEICSVIEFERILLVHIRYFSLKAVVFVAVI
jgi:hypothetical protein